MQKQLTDRPSWTMCIVNAALACGVFYAVLNSEQKVYVVILTIVGTMSAITAIRECPIRLADHLPLVSGALALLLAALFIRSGLGYYNQGLKIVIVVLIFAFAAFSFWEYFTRRTQQVNQASH
jgi:hypothetical protein